ncbi:hypothetical protein ACHHYP_16206 [Achlya hypogyna]|uniref:Expansin-like EG45 domain-containing protein n=1 Tax=Achlya hypogyna TaxID=1202772 RepID=A0A1V9Y9C1_ACHHY|nr:hypothetical protein ACHHYP_16206 [Achlya hypogyna]
MAADDTFYGDGTSYTLDVPVHGNCNLMWTPAVAAENYAALNDPQWANLANCGRCAQVRCVDPQCTSKASVLVMFVDRCPECKHGDVDLGPSAFHAITGLNSTRLKIAWSFAPCPVQGPMNICLKTGSSPHWLAVQPSNVPLGVRSVRVQGYPTTMLDSCFYFKPDTTALIPLENLRVDITFIDDSMKGVLIPSIGAATCTNGYREVASEAHVQDPAGSSAAAGPLVPLLVTAVVLGVAAALFIAWRVRQQRAKAARISRAFRLVVPVEDDVATL